MKPWFMRASVVFMCAAFAAGAAAADWKPERSVEVIVGTKPGGGQDKTARTLQHIMQERHLVEVPVAVVNKPGAGGSVGWTYLNQHPGDGQFIEIGNPSLLTAHIMGRTPIAYTDVTPLAILLSESVAFSVLQDSPLKSGRDLVARLRRDVGSISVSVGSSLGSTNHVALALVAKGAGADPRRLKAVVFEGGGAAMTALLGGHIDLIASAANNVVGHIAAGRIRVIAVAAPQRLGGALAGVPTWREQGIDAVVTNWRLVAGPKGLSAAQIAYWQDVLGRLVATDEWKQDLERNLFENTFMTSADTARFLESQNQAFHATLSAVGLAK